MQTRQPNWKKWLLIPDVQVWKAAALSLNIDPDKIRHDEDGWMVQKHLFHESQEFIDRVDVITANLGKNSMLVVRAIRIGQPVDCEINLPAFAAWSIFVKWEIPQELVGLIVAAEMHSSESAPLQEIEQAARSKQEVQNFTDIADNSEKSKPERPFDVRERKSVAQIISVLAAIGKLDLSAPYAAAETLQAAAAQYGLELPASKDTIVKFLKAPTNPNSKD